MSDIQPIKSMLQSLRNQKCQRPKCLSENRGNLDAVWFGKQYDNKRITCISCYMMDDEAIKNSLPTTYNVLPALSFFDKLMQELRTYEERKKQANWHPLLMKEKKTKINHDLNTFEAYISATLTRLQSSLQNFLKKIQLRNKEIFTHPIMNEIIDMKGRNQFQGLLQKINLLVKQLNYSAKSYQFERIDLRNKKLEKEKEKILEVTQKVNKVLVALLEDIKQRNQTIAKI